MFLNILILFLSSFYLINSIQFSNSNWNSNPTINLNKIFSKVGIPSPTELLKKETINLLINKNKNNIKTIETKSNNYKTGFWTFTWRANNTCDTNEPIILSAGFRIGQCYSSTDNDDDDGNNIQSIKNIHNNYKQNLRTKNIQLDAGEGDDDDDGSSVFSYAYTCDGGN